MARRKRKSIDNNWKYRKAKYAYQHGLKNNKPVSLKDLEERLRIGKGHIYVWKQRYNWDDLTDFIDVGYPLTPDKVEKLAENKKRGNIVTAEFLEQLRKLAQYKEKNGRMLTAAEVSEQLGISTAYFYQLKNKNVDIALIWERRQKIAEVEEATFQAAIGIKTTETIVKQGKTPKGEINTTETKDKYIAPDMRAAKFILERQGEGNWKEQKQEETKINVEEKLPPGLREVLNATDD